MAATVGVDINAPGLRLYSADWTVANMRVIEPGPTCGPGVPKVYSIRTIPAGSMLVFYGDMATQAAFSQACTCGQTPCTYYTHGTTAPLPLAVQLAAQQ